MASAYSRCQVAASVYNYETELRLLESFFKRVILRQMPEPVRAASWRLEALEQVDCICLRVHLCYVPVKEICIASNKCRGT